MTFEQRLKEGKGENLVDVGRKSEPGRGDCKDLNREHTRKARGQCNLSKGNKGVES